MNTWIKLMMVMAMVLAGSWLVEAKAQEAQLSIMFVDLDSVFTNYYKTRDAEAQLKVQADEMKAERKSLLESLEKLQEAYNGLRAQAQSSALNEDARTVKRAEAEEKLMEVKDAETKLRRMEETAQRRMDEQSRRARTRLLEEINVMIREHATKRGYAAIIDTSGDTLNGVPPVVFHQAKFDITEEIISLINAKKP